MFGTYKVSDLTTVGAVTPLPWVIQMLALTLGLTTVFCLLMGLLFLQTGSVSFNLDARGQLVTSAAVVRDLGVLGCGFAAGWACRRGWGWGHCAEHVVLVWNITTAAVAAGDSVGVDGWAEGFAALDRSDRAAVPTRWSRSGTRRR